MRYEEYAPPARWRAAVRCAWHLEGGARADAPTERVIPDGRLEIVVHLRDPFRRIAPDGTVVAARAAVVAGQLTRALRLVPTGAVRCFGLRLEPAGARAVLRAPLSDFEDGVRPLEDVLGDAGRGLAERLGDATDGAAAARTAWAWLDERVGSAPRASACDAALARWRADLGAASVEEVSASVGLSRRQLERRFRAEIGLGPKRFARVVRLDGAVRALRANPRRGLAALALDVGCTDQAHLTREFVDLAGLPPSRWLAEQHDVADAFLDGVGSGEG